jgi:hypothetical protein
VRVYEDAVRIDEHAGVDGLGFEKVGELHTAGFFVFLLKVRGNHLRVAW